MERSRFYSISLWNYLIKFTFAALFDVCVYCEMITAIMLVNTSATSQLPFVCV